MKVAFIIGHNESDKGAFSKPLNVSEWDLYKSLESDLKTIGDVFYHDKSIKGYVQRCKEISSRIGKGYDLIVALHFNSFNGSANGCEAFYRHSNIKGYVYAKKFVDTFTKSTGISVRGVKPYVSETVRGAGEVFYPKSTAILLEPFFGDNVNDCEKFDKCKFIMALRAMVS